MKKDKRDQLGRIFWRLKESEGIALANNPLSRRPMFLRYKSLTPELTEPIWSKVDWACCLHRGFIFINDEILDQYTMPALVNILCHEMGHLIDACTAKTPVPKAGEATLEGVIAFESAANEHGRRLFKLIYPNLEYWDNHKDIQRMHSSTKYYNSAGDQHHKPELPSHFFIRKECILA